MDPENLLDPSVQTNSNNEQPPAPPTENTPEPVATLPPELLSAYNGMLSDAANEKRRLQQELDALRAERNAPAPKTPEESSKEFFENPVALIQREIANAIKPLNESFAQTKRANDYANLKTQMRADPRFNDLASIESEFDALMSNQPLDPQLMIAAYYAAFGKAAKEGRINSLAPTPTPTPTRQVVTPPHLRPTPPAAPAPTPTNNLRPLTENEMTVMRYNKMTHEEYLRGLGEIK